MQANHLIPSFHWMLSLHVRTAKKNTKKHHYLEAASARRASFTPFIATCDAVLDIEAEGYLKRLAVLLSEKWESPYSKTIGWLRA